VEGLEHACRTLGKPDLGEERHASAGVASDWPPVTEDEPPAFVPRFFGLVVE
jgi:hypothetical protein